MDMNSGKIGGAVTGTGESPTSIRFGIRIHLETRGARVRIHRIRFCLDFQELWEIPILGVGTVFTKWYPNVELARAIRIAVADLLPDP